METSTEIASIAFIVPYFGSLPNYFQLWLTSCKFNPTVDWYVFTDDHKGYDCPDNVHVIYATFEEIVRRFQECFDFTLLLTKPYKLCDFKPTYGVVFNDYLKGYKFWGFCDIDVIFGNIRRFITNDILNANDKILSHGHFTLFRNTFEVNNIFRQTLHGRIIHEEIFSSFKAKGFDEYGSRSVRQLFLNSNKCIYENSGLFADLHYGKRHFVLTKCPEVMSASDYEIYTSEKRLKRNTIFSFHQGRLARHCLVDEIMLSEDYLYVHLQKRAMRLNLADLCAESFMIVPNKFTDYMASCNADDLRRLGKRRIFSSLNTIKLIKYNIKIFIKNRFERFYVRNIIER